MGLKMTREKIGIVQKESSYLATSIRCCSTDQPVADPGEGCRGCAPPPEGHFLLNMYFLKSSLNIWCLCSCAPPPENGAPP